MADIVDPQTRSRIMSGIRGKNTKPEMLVRRLLHSMGYRYRLHARELPGKPDIVFRRQRIAIFVHGCFWHQHSGCRLSRMPKSRVCFWQPKLEANKLRDQNNHIVLENNGWRVLTVWECQLADIADVKETLVRFIEKKPR